jgi:predicted RNA-binding Zn-ribbon protein involved in translation (DUF1610 family)
MKLTCEVCGTVKDCKSKAEMEEFSAEHSHPIKYQYDKMVEVINRMNLEIKALQLTCNHAFATKKHCGSTGNYDRDDSYWTEFKCPECGKNWTERGSK